MNKNELKMFVALYIPKIGAGIAGGDWELIEKLINLATPDIDIMVVEYEG
ncbi:hypothetical protein vBKpnAMK2_00291 [Klebsiella phage vB_Kpn_AM_K2]